jgi:hypothetical protein
MLGSGCDTFKSPMAWKFCAYCGAPVIWPKAAQGHLETRLSCANCGGELYRNPDIHVVCLFQHGLGSDIGVIGGPMADHETVQAAGQRLLAQVQRGELREENLRLFALVNDFDDERVLIIFRALVPLDFTRTVAAVEPWMSALTVELRHEVEAGGFHVYRGVMSGGKLQLVQELPEHNVV